MSLIDRFERVVRRLGGTLVQGPVPEEFQAPFDREVGLDYESKTLYVSNESMYLELIHEAAHVFASLVVPDKCDTDFGFIGWELALARELRCYKAWVEGTLMGYWIPWQVLQLVFPELYNGEGDAEFSELEDEFQKRVLTYILESTVANGLVVNGKVTSIRG